MAKEDTDQAAEVITNEQAPEAVTEKPGKVSRLKGAHKNLWQWMLTNKKFSLPLAAIAVLGLLLAMPFTRYGLLGLVLKQNFAIVVVDAQTNAPVSSARVALKGVVATTDGNGRADLKVPVGSTEVSVTKQYYKDNTVSVTVPIGTPKDPAKVTLRATGRQVPIRVINTISGKPVKNAALSAANTQVRTDSKGQATIVVPPGTAELVATIKASGYNNTSVKLRVTTASIPANTFQITPAGKVYFLSNRTGKLDVVKANLDGSERTIVLPGTGNEDKANTVLLASRDWKYIALLSKRDGGDSAKLFLIETDSDKLTTMDEGNAAFSLYGWSGDRFVYSVVRNNYQQWQPRQQALKSYQASTKRLTTLDETAAAGDGPDNYVKESFGDVYILNKEVVFTKSWDGSVGLGDRQATLNSVQSDGSQRKVVKSYPAAINGPYATVATYASVDTRPGDFGELYIRYFVTGDTRARYDAYEDGKLKSATLSDDQYLSDPYNTYIVSPSDNKTLWTEVRDGKNVFFVGDGKGASSKELGTTSDEYSAYGWYSDDYLLLTKKGSEMHIMSVDGAPGGIEASFKLSDYYKPNYFIRGYGYGYGG